MITNLPTGPTTSNPSNIFPQDGLDSNVVLNQKHEDSITEIERIWQGYRVRKESRLRRTTVGKG